MTEHEGILRYKDEEGADHAIYPETRMHLVDGLEEQLEEMEKNAVTLQNSLTLFSGSKIDDAYVGEDGCLYLISNGEVVVGPLGPFAGGGGGEGGGSGNNAVLTLTNTSGWMMNTVVTGSDVRVEFDWSSLEGGVPTGNGAMKIFVNGTVKEAVEIPQGRNIVSLTKYLTDPNNLVRITVSDTYGNTRAVNYTVNVVQAYVTSSFEAGIPYSGQIVFPYTPTGALKKTMHFILDGEEIGSVEVTASGRQQTFRIPAQSHGVHMLRVYFTAESNGAEFRSNELYYELICLEEGNMEPVIAFTKEIREASRYESVPVQYYVYDPASLVTEISLLVNGEESGRLIHGRELQTWTYFAGETGTFRLGISCKGFTRTQEIQVAEGEIDIHLEEQDLDLNLRSYGRSNNEQDPSKWEFGDIRAVLTDFNFKSNGWISDEEQNVALRVSGDARVEIPYYIFENDFRNTGKTIELVFRTRDVMDYDTEILTCYANGRGIRLTAQMAKLNSEQSEVSTQFKEDTVYHLAFVVDKRSEHRLLSIYIDGVLSGCVQYPESDDFSQRNPAGISIGSDRCTIDLYSIRVYNQNLSRFQILENWIADTRDVPRMLERFRRNNTFDAYGGIIKEKLPETTPYMILRGAVLPQYKGDKKTIDGDYVDRVHPERSFGFTGAEIDVQGTSSQYYERKNYKIKFRNGFRMTHSSEIIPKYQLREDSIPTATFTMKADVASCEGANNVELVRLYNDTCPFKMPSQMENPSVRQGIDGYPIVMFWDDGNGTTFLGKYNFNNDKGTPEVYGFKAGDESWETLNNTSSRVLYQSADFSDSGWENDFEARYPDGNTDVENLSRFAEWVVSTKNDPEKFRRELGLYADIDSSVFMYLFTEVFLMVDSRAKNSFPTLLAVDGGKKVCWLPYDMDTALGINNEGLLVFSYDLEDVDHLEGGADVFNGQESVFWKNMRICFFDEIKAMYQKLRRDGIFSYEEVTKRFRDHQEKWPESIFNEDAYYKYLQPLFEKNNGTYLGMLQGTKAAQREWWLYNRFRYMDSKYNAGDALRDTVVVRGYAKGDISVTPYAAIYASVKYGSYLVQKRALRGGTYRMECPLDNVNDTEIIVYSASQIADMGDLAPLKVGFADFTNGTKLQTIKVGDGSPSYENPNMQELHLGNNVLLKLLDARNCSNLRNSVDISGCSNIEEVYFDGTSVSAVQLPDGGSLKKLHLPATVTNLTVMNQNGLTEFVMPSYENISTLRIEHSGNTIPMEDILDSISDGSRVRLIGFEKNVDSFEEIKAFMDNLDRFRGLSENGSNMEKAQVYGVFRIQSITGEELDEVQSRYPDIQIVTDHLKTFLSYYNFDGSELLYTETIQDGGDGNYTGSPSRSADAQYTYVFAGWALYTDGAADANATKNITANRRVYAAYTKMIRSYKIRFLNASGAVLQNGTLAYGSMPVYSGGTPVYDGSSPDDFGAFIGWTPQIAKVTGAVDYKAQFEDLINYVRAYFVKKTTRLDDGMFDNLTSIRDYAFYEHMEGTNSMTAIERITLLNLTNIGSSAFAGKGTIKVIDLGNVENIGVNAFYNIGILTAIVLRNPNKVCVLGAGNTYSLGSGCKIYVPSALIDEYKVATNWSTIAGKFAILEGSKYEYN